MGLFGRPSPKVIAEFREKLVVTGLSKLLPIETEPLGGMQYNPLRDQFAAEAEHLPCQFFLIPAERSLADFGATCVVEELDPILSKCSANVAHFALTSPEPQEEDLISIADIVVYRGGGSLIDISANVSPVGLLFPSDLKSKAFEFKEFNVVVKRCSFQANRDVPAGTLFDSRGRARTTSHQIAPVPAPDRPPSLKKADLQERLRWILTPPIHELLSDPQLALPEKPFPYQTHGIKWLYDRESALLADEMGLGKTMQAIIAARLLFREGLIKQILIICPKSLIPNWKKELREWWPSVTSYTKVVESDRRWFLRDARQDAVVKIINYEALRRELDWLKEKPRHHDLVIIDEAQWIKSPDTDTSRAVKALAANRRWALTGTPVENSAADFVSIFEFLQPSLLRETDSIDMLRNKAKPYMLRRRQAEVLPDLPEKIEQDIEIELTERQREAYDRAESEGVIELNQKGETISITHVFALITKLQQICNFELAGGESAKTDLLLKELEEIIESGRKALIFGRFVDDRFGLKRLAKALADSRRFRNSIRFLELHGEVNSRNRDAVVHDFQNDPACRILLVNYKTGGVGLNLQAANYVFLFDRWWNPAVEDQAIKRCHRLGQKHAVFAQRFYCKGTIEERILQKLAERRRLFSHIVDDANPTAAQMGLTEDEIFSLFDLTVRPKRASRAVAPSGPIPIVLDNQDPKEFEALVARIYEKEGYDVTLRGRSHDGGIDILAEKVAMNGKERVIVQCKHQKDNVGRPVLQQLWGVVNSDASMTRGDLVTSAMFTREAKEFAVGKRLTLIDRSKLQELAKRHGVAEFVTLSDTQSSSAREHEGKPSQPPANSERNSPRTPANGPAHHATDAEKTVKEPDSDITLDVLCRRSRLGWENFLRSIGLPVGYPITRYLTLAQAREIARRNGDIAH